MSEPAEILTLAENIIEHGDNIAYPSRQSSQYVRKVMRGLVEAFRDMETRALHAEAVLAEQDSRRGPPAQRGGPTATDPNRPYCKPDQSCCDFCCGN